MLANDLHDASPRTKRKARYEWELKAATLEAIFTAGSPVSLRAALGSKVQDTAHYSMLPKYRQIALEAYAQGALDAMARMAGKPTIAPPPDLGVVVQSDTGKKPQPRRKRRPSGVAKRKQRAETKLPAPPSLPSDLMPAWVRHSMAPLGLWAQP